MTCPQCGRETPSDAGACSSCGAPVKPGAGTDAPAPAQPEIREARGITWLSYVNVLLLIPMFALKDNRFAMHHVKQGLVLLAIFIAAAVVSLLPVLGTIASIVGYVVVAVLSVVGIANSLMGVYWVAPFGVGRLARLFRF